MQNLQPKPFPEPSPSIVFDERAPPSAITPTIKEQIDYNLQNCKAFPKCILKNKESRSAYL